MKQVVLALAFQCISALLFSQFSFHGKIINEEGKSLSGASVVIKNTNQGTISDENGEFSIINIKDAIIEIQVYYLGYKSQNININLVKSNSISLTMEPDNIMGEEIIVSATRVKPDIPVAHYNITKGELEQNNYGKDIPYLLQLTPSFISGSDGGTGIGYTSFRIRGTGMERINVTINGIPFNDAESHSVYWVDLPDIASSTENIQIQRGVGTSSNGAGAFGATLNFQTSTLHKKPFAEYNCAYGSFNTVKNTVRFGTGLLDNNLAFEGRLSKISSDGFIDRAWSDLKSLYFSGGYYGDKNILKLNIFSGIEETYQAWNGIPKVRLNNDTAGMLRYEEHWLYTPEQTEHMIKSNNRTYNLYTYKNEIDHYIQSHYQLHYSRKITNQINFNTSVHYTYGNGYYEQYREKENLTDYQIDTLFTGFDTITQSDLIRRKWLDNNFYGITYSLLYNHADFDFTLGGGFHNYDGNHFGRVIWSEFASNSTIDYEWYRNKGKKMDINFYTKINYHLTPALNLYADIQYRKIDYSINGIDDDLFDISIKSIHYSFLNPKTGIFYKINNQQDVFFSFATGNREPMRSDLTDALKKSEVKLPEHETLYDYEFGYSLKTFKINCDANIYYMKYINQLVQTGEINNVGDPLLINVKNSYRRGIELAIALKATPYFYWSMNTTFSQNKIIGFTEHLDDWDTGEQISKNLGTTDISFSPAIIASNQFQYNILNGLHIIFISKYVGRQYIDNTSSLERSIEPYIVNDLVFRYSLKKKIIKKLNLYMSVNNLLNRKYETNAWVYRYYFGGSEYTMDGYFPQAGRHFIAGLDLSF